MVWAEYSLAEVDEALPALGDEDVVREVYERLRGWTAMRIGRISGRGFDHIRGALALRLDLVDEAEGHYRTGLEWAERERCPVEQGRNLQGLAEVAERHGRRSEARRRLEGAVELFRAHGAKLWLGEAQERLVELDASPSRRRAEYPDGLSEREVVVLTQIASGKTSPEIAEELMISPRTVDRHVANILNKTGLSNRAEAAAYAERQGLTGGSGAG